MCGWLHWHMNVGRQDQHDRKACGRRLLSSQQTGSREWKDARTFSSSCLCSFGTPGLSEGAAQIQGRPSQFAYTHANQLQKHPMGSLRHNQEWVLLVFKWVFLSPIKLLIWISLHTLRKKRKNNERNSVYLICMLE